MTDQEAYEAWFLGEQGKPYDEVYTFAKAAFHAGIAWLRSQGEPVATLYGDNDVPKSCPFCGGSAEFDCKGPCRCAKTGAERRK